MSTWSNRMELWADGSLVDLMAHVEGEWSDGGAHLNFVLEDEMLDGIARKAPPWRPEQPDWYVAIDFSRAAHDARANQARQQVLVFGPVLTSEAVDAARLDHEDRWTIATRAKGNVTVTDLPEAADHELTIALCEWLDANDISFARRDLGRI